ncbi:hypothetical protein J1N35_012870 [Gossypium stocksii]|uniref:NLP1-9 GAF domain-containing protein n=1 Tax=Gossypium stocksii TaxID=47602 RepID=A0A9D3VT28_9ROSI|nr:hypothetical protein J1N35_012870 [Gossypium stocksii]
MAEKSHLSILIIFIKLKGLALNRLAALAEIHDISKDLCCKCELSLALTWTSKVNNMNETMLDPNNKFPVFIQSNSCYVKYMKAYKFMRYCELDLFMINPLIIEKAFESRDG